MVRGVKRWARDIYLRQKASSIRKASNLPSYSTLDKGEKFYLAAVAIFRGEYDYLLEWLEFHLMMGVDHFFLYDNDDIETSKLLLKTYIDNNVITHIPFPNLPRLRKKYGDFHILSLQDLAYGDCIYRFKKHTKWLMKFDIDEFIYPNGSRGYTTIKEVLKSLSYEEIKGIEINMQDFGSSGHQKKPTGLVIESYTHTAYQPRKDCKCIGNTKFLRNVLYSHPHKFDYKSSLRERIFGYPRVLRGKEANDLLRLNHYITKSLEEYERKSKTHSNGWKDGKETIDRFRKTNQYCNVIEDNKEIMRYMPGLKKRLRGK